MYDSLIGFIKEVIIVVFFEAVNWFILCMLFIFVFLFEESKGFEPSWSSLEHSLFITSSNRSWTIVICDDLTIDFFLK